MKAERIETTEKCYFGSRGNVKTVLGSGEDAKNERKGGKRQRGGETGPDYARTG